MQLSCSVRGVTALRKACKAQSICSVAESRGRMCLLLQLGDPLLGLLVIRALPFWVYIEAPEFWKLPCVAAVLNCKVLPGQVQQSRAFPSYRTLIPKNQTSPRVQSVRALGSSREALPLHIKPTAANHLLHLVFQFKTEFNSIP